MALLEWCWASEWRRPRPRTFEHQGADEIPGSQKGSQRPQIQGASGHIKPSGVEQSGTSGRTQHRPPTLRKYLLSSRSRVRVAVGAPTVQVNQYFRNYRRFNDILRAGNHSQVVCRPAYARTDIAATRQNCGQGRGPSMRSATGEPTASVKADMSRLLFLIRRLGRPEDTP